MKHNHNIEKNIRYIKYVKQRIYSTKL